MKRMIVTGSSGLIGSEVVSHFADRGWEVHGVDNNLRADFFGPGGDTRWNQARLQREHDGFRHHELDIRDRGGVLELIAALHPDAIVHAAAQPSHDLAASRPFDDFDVNATGTLNLLEGTRQVSREIPFVHMSTNKVYGDAPNRLPLEELETRWEYGDPGDRDGIREDFPIDDSMHSLFGASKVAADVMVQEYGRYFDMPTCCLRGGCLTGPAHSGVELHGFLSYQVKCNVQGILYRVFGIVRVVDQTSDRVPYQPLRLLDQVAVGRHVPVLRRFYHGGQHVAIMGWHVSPHHEGHRDRASVTRYRGRFRAVRTRTSVSRPPQSPRNR